LFRIRDSGLIGFKENNFVYRSILTGGTNMKRFTFFLIALATTVGLVAIIGPAASHADGQSAPYVTLFLPGIATGSGFLRPMKQAT
jgi:hypothetical protein